MSGGGGGGSSDGDGGSSDSGRCLWLCGHLPVVTFPRILSFHRGRSHG